MNKHVSPKVVASSRAVEDRPRAPGKPGAKGAAGPKAMQISLRAGERIFVNGAVLRVDRKVTLQLLNEVTFLLESHVMQVEDTTTPLRQLYFVVQSMLMDPLDVSAAKMVFADQINGLMGSLTSESLRTGVMAVADLVAAGRAYEALRTIRGLLPIEDSILETSPISTKVA
nr:flagellar biosynthesis repressor FlbT [Segnochrobactrum spirostomi]